MARHGASGEVTISEREARVVRATVAALTDVDEFSSGGAHGVDTVAAIAAVEAFPGALHRLVLPAKWHNYGVVKMVQNAHRVAHGERELKLDVVELADGTDYMDRNDVLASFVDVLSAFPAEADEQVRSGTWATVRRVRKRGGEARIHPLLTLAPTSSGRGEVDDPRDVFG